MDNIFAIDLYNRLIHQNIEPFQINKREKLVKMSSYNKHLTKKISKYLLI